MSYRLNLLILPMLGCLLSGVLTAQSFRPGMNIDIIGPERGLPDRNINFISQDKLGFIWIATGTGLFRYDGYKFENFNHLLSIAANEISVREIINDNHGSLWVTSRAGVSKIDPYYLTSRILTGRSIDSAVKRASLPLRIYAGRNDHIWVALNDGYFLILNHDLKITATFQSGYAGPNLQNKGHYATFMTNAQNSDLFLYANRDYIDRVSVNGKKVKRFNFPEFKLNGISFIPGYVEYRNDSLFLVEYMSYESQDVYFVEFFIHEGKFGRYFKSQTAFVHSTTTDSLGNLWQSNGYNLHIRQKGENRFENITGILEEKVGPGKYLGGLFTSRDGTVWMNTNAELIKINIARDNFNRYLNIPAINESTVGPSMRGMMEDRNGGVWVCSYGYQQKDMSYCIHRLYGKKIEHKRMVSAGQEYFLGFYPMYKMAAAGSDFIAVSDGPMVLKIDPATMKTYQYELMDSTAGNEFVNVTPINDSLLWLGSRNGMFKLNIRTFKSINYNRSDPKQYINNTRVNFIMRWGPNWLATTSNGVYSFREDGKILRYYGSEKGADISLPATTYYHAFDDGRKLYLGSASGLIEVDTLAGTSKMYTVDEGLPDNNIYAVLNDTLGNLWLSTNNGLARWNTFTKKVRNYFVRDGLSHKEFNNASFLKASDGTLYFGGLNGFVSFSPYTIDTTALPVSDVNLVNVSWYSQEGKKQLAYQFNFKNKRLYFKPGSRMIEFSFMVPEYLHVSQNRFRYKILGWNDESWNAFEAGNRLILNSVPAGSYTLIVQHSVSGGEWSENQWEGEIVILKPWYNTIWFYTLMAITLLALAYGFYRYRMNQLMAVLNVRNRISADMHDEIGSTLSSISYFSQAVMMQSTDEKVKEVLQRIKSNAQQVQESLSDIVWSVKPGNDQAESVFSRMYRFGNEFTEAKGISFVSIVDPSLNTLQLDMDERRDIYLIFKEAVNNAVKYSECKKIIVHIMPQGQKIRMEITDDGKGFEFNHSELGNGLSNMQLRAKHMKGDLQVVSEIGKGTTVRLVF